jgi:serine/threonine-protein kinase
VPKPEVGQIIAGKYRIDREIGAGGMGTVVAATHLQLGTQLALKFLNEKIKGSANSVERFTREARACAQLRSEHVCRVSDFGVEGDTPYIAMDLLAGVDLARLLDTGRVDLAIAVDFVIQACTGLAEAHAHGIVHRDLKPGNLFLTRRPDGMPLIKVLDFGVAKIPVDDDISLTKTSHIVGSPGYMAPEQLRSSKTVDQRADLWALGVILYELISGRHPFYAEAVTEVALKIAMDEPPQLAEAPDELRAIVMRCLAKEAEYRFRDVTELATALAPFAHHDRIAAAAAMRVLVETAERERIDPQAPTETSGAGTATKQERPTRVDAPRAMRPPESTNQHGAGAIVDRPPAKRRVAWIAGGVLVAGIAGAVGFAAVRSSSQDLDPLVPAPPDAAPAIAVLPDAAILDDATYRELRVMLEIKITGASAATIVVDDIVWGEGSRISVPVLAGKHKIEVRAPGRPLVIEEHDITADRTISIVVPPKPRADEPVASAGRTIPVRPAPDLMPPRGSTGIEDPFASSKSTGSGSGSDSKRTPAVGSGSAKPEPAVGTVNNTDQALADAKLATFRGSLARLGLRQDDLGIEGVKLNNELSRARRKKDWLEVQRVAVRMNDLANATKIDRPFISSKHARLASHVRRAQLSDDVRAQIDQLMREVAAKTDDPVEANRKLNRAFALLPAAPRSPTREVDPLRPTPRPDDLLAPKPFK